MARLLVLRNDFSLISPFLIVKNQANIGQSCKQDKKDEVEVPELILRPTAMVKL